MAAEQTNDAKEKKSGGAEPTKYIRTFAGDMAAFKAGQIPELAPLKKRRAGEAAETPMPQEVPAPAQTPSVPLPPPLPPRPVPGHLSIPTLITTPFQEEPAPPPAPPVKPIPPAPAPLPPPSPIIAPAPAAPSPLHTYSEDFTDRVRQKQASKITILAAEQDAGRHHKDAARRAASTRNALSIATGVLLFALGAGGVYYAYTRYLTRTAPVAIAPVAATPIFVDARETVSGTDGTLLTAVAQSAARPLSEGQVRLLSLSNASTSMSVFAALALPAPGVLLRNVNTAGSIAGVINIAGSQSPFFILSVASYGDTFAGMLAWEPALPHDFAALFPSATPSRPSSAGFHDEVVANHDARVYTDAAGHDALVYGYWNAGILIIARDKAAFSALISRLSTSRT